MPLWSIRRTGDTSYMRKCLTSRQFYSYAEKALSTPFASAKRPDLKILQPEKTLTGGPIQQLQKGLPKTTTSLCPDCATTTKIPGPHL